MLAEDAAEEGGVEEVDGEEELVDSMRALDMKHFAQVGAPAENPPVLLLSDFPL